MGYPTVNGVPLDQIFDPYISGTKAPITNYTVKISGVDVDLRDLFAPIYLGTSAPPTNYKVNNADLNTFFAKKGTAGYSLPINGQSFTSNAGSRGHAQLDFNLNSDGSYTIVRSGTSITTTTLASGTWLPSGASVSDFTARFVASQSGSTVDGGTNSMTNGAPSPSALTTSRTLSAMSDANLTSDRASATAIVTAYLYRSGTLMSTTVVNFNTNANGN